MIFFGQLFKKIMPIAPPKDMKNTEEDKYIQTKSVKEALKIDGCSIMHLRTTNKLRFIKKGNSYLYNKQDVEAILRDKKLIKD